MNITKGAGTVLVGLALVFGLKYYNKQKTHDTMKQRLLELCEGEAPCQSAVNAHFEPCFEENFRLGSRNNAARLNTEPFLGCINQRSGYIWFRFEPKEPK